MMKKFYPPIAWMIFIFILSSVPGRVFPQSLFHKFAWFAHVIEYSILGFLWIRVLEKKYLVVLLICIMYGVSDELHQIFVKNRMCSIFDIGIDTISAGIGIVLYNVKIKLNLKQNTAALE